MYCTHCGKVIDDSTRFCCYCGGSQALPEQNNSANSVSGQPYPQQAQPVYQQPQQPYQQPPQSYQQQPYHQQVQPYVPYSGYYTPDGMPMNPAQPQMPMKWFKFLIYFGLFFGAFINAVTGVMSIFGLTYSILGYEPAFIYSLVDNLQMIDSVYGVTMLALAAMRIITRFQLAKFKRYAPKMFMIVIAVETVFTFIYSIAYNTVLQSADFLRDAMDLGADAGLIFGTVILLIGTGVYFNKRKHLFVN